ncbi:MAG TPA: 2Fe-2S iron-sulfur cluster-binding protein [Mucilaginibacter sp.]
MEEKDQFHSEENNASPKAGSTRRQFLGQIGLAGVGLQLAPVIAKAAGVAALNDALPAEPITLSFTVNGMKKSMVLDTRVTLLDALREKLGMTGSKKGCDHGQCGACTVLLDGKRINSCLHLAVMCDGAKVTTIEGLATGETLHPMQAAFLKHDGFQCGYCTPGQICSAVGLVKEGHAHTDEEIKEQMSGNICRCGAYNNILDAIKEVQNA